VRIKELQLIGFKSFQDKATLRFSNGLNAIIGPNGCGKTNVLDALRWVLGEQSFALLRCAKNEDLVFGGTATEPPLNYAEVKLVMEDAEQPQAASPKPQAPESEPEASSLKPEPAVQPTEIEIRRRYFRSGESEYYLNKQPCRLRDIQEVFLSSGAGTKAYSIFDLRQMREIISGNIRRMFEEAAALAKYHEAKADCLRKLELTASDLVRLDDIIAERERVVRSLQRQAGKLRAFERLKSEEKGLRLLELKADYEAVKRDLEMATADTAAMEDAEARRVAEMSRLDEELRSHRARLRDLEVHKDELGARLREKRQALSDLEGKNLLDRQRIELLDSSVRSALEERAVLEDSVRQLEQVFARTVERLAEASEKQTLVQDRLDRQREVTRQQEERLYALRSHDGDLREQLQELLGREYGAGQELARLEASAENQREAIARLKTEVEAVESRRRETAVETTVLEQRIGQLSLLFEEHRSRVAELAAGRDEAKEKRGRVLADASRLRAEQAELEKELAVLSADLATEQARAGREALAERLLGEVSRFLEPAPGWERACEAALYAVVDFLAVSGADSAALEQTAARRPDLTFSFLTQERTPDAEGRTETRLADDAVVGLLSEYVKVSGAGPGALAALVAGVFVCRSTQDLDRLSRAHPGRTFVTRDGVCRFADGRVVVASRDRGRLSLERMHRERTARQAELSCRLAELETKETELARYRDETETQIARLQFDAAATERDRASQEAALTLRRAAAEELGRDAERLRAEARSFEAQLRSAEEKRQGVEVSLGEVKQRVEAARSALAGAAEQASELERTVKAGLELSSQALAELSEARQAASRLEAENAFAKREIDDGHRRLSELAAGAARHREEIAVSEQEISGRLEAIAAAGQDLAGLEHEFEGMNVADLARAEEALDANLAEQRQSQQQNQRLLLDQRLKQYELNQKFGRIAEEARTTYGTDIAEFQPDALDGVSEKLAMVRRKLELLGQVNQLAAEEYSLEKSDLEKLRVQREDVANAKVNLEQTLLEIDRHAQEQFAATYNEVRTHFREIFKALFLEGEADLVMVNDANPLESEIGIVAKPRGKNPKRLEQLSDGEKALLAVSLLFAFYRVKPAPFCFLDEVDAPLDDANVGRFADYLKGISDRTQVVIITHNRLTVERADVVFGVTAEQPGISRLVSVSLADYRRQQEQNPPPAS
jgi:chromosome segregation protein